MTMPNNQSLTIIDISPLGERILDHKTTALLKSSELELLRLVLPSGKAIPEHKSPGAITVQCLEGRIVFNVKGKSCELTAGQMLYLDAGIPHSLQALTHASVLVTRVRAGVSS
jgi:quercetin dioxygenase-like cupin family protein